MYVFLIYQYPLDLEGGRIKNLESWNEALYFDSVNLLHHITITNKINLSYSNNKLSSIWCFFFLSLSPKLTNPSLQKLLMDT